MCCTTEKQNNQTLHLIKYKIHAKKAMLKEANKKKNCEALFFEYKNLLFCIQFSREYFKGMNSLGFHAMSKGFEAYTETGYKSNIVGSNGEVGREDVEIFFKARILESGIDLDNPKPFLLSDVGGVANVSQPSLF